MDERSGHEQRYPCMVCGKSYLRKGHLKRHMTNECIGIQPKYMCDVCPARYKRSEDLRRHLLRAHNIVRSGQRSRTIDDYVIGTASTEYYDHSRGASAVPDAAVMERPIYISEFETPSQYHTGSKQLQAPTPSNHQQQYQHRLHSASSSDFDNQHFLDY
uniref:C2H2-type domain-containing protein n=1 Tax=Musca domestica TaxID=7370 RepID=A0A1I8NJY3_MUSDO